MKRIALALAAAFIASMTLSACNTMEGFGQDVQKTGEKIESAADKKK